MSNNHVMPERKIWFVKHPISQYKEHVKLLARKNHLRILDAQFEGDYPAEVVEQNPPKLTVEKKPAKSAKAKAPAVDVEAIKAEAEAEAKAQADEILAKAQADAEATIKAAEMQAKATTDAAAKAAAGKK